MNKFEHLCAVLHTKYLGNEDTSDLSKQFIEHFNQGLKRRIKVQFPYEGIDGKPETMWGFVSVTSGVKPVFLLMKRYNQVGSSDILKDDCKILAYKDKL